MAEWITQKEIKKETQKIFKAINIKLKILKALQEMALLNKDLDRAVFEEKVKEQIGEADLSYIHYLIKNDKSPDDPVKD